MKQFFSKHSMKYFFPIAALSFVFLFNGCKKKDITYTITGVIHDNCFNTTLDSAQVTITATGSPKDDFTKTITTGPDGVYSITFNRVKYSNIEVKVEKPGYFPTSANYILDDLIVNGSYTANFSVDAKAWVNLHFTGDGTKTVKYFKQQGYNGCAECCPTGDQYLYNVLDEEITCMNKGNQIYQIYYFVEQTNQHGQVDVISTPFEYTELLVEVQ